jgi:hypothetical protein
MRSVFSQRQMRFFSKKSHRDVLRDTTQYHLVSWGSFFYGPFFSGSVFSGAKE